MQNFRISCLALLGLLMLLFSGQKSFGQRFNPDEVLGQWTDEGKTVIIELYRVGRQYSGRIVWTRDSVDRRTGLPRRDIMNSDPKLRHRKVVGSNMVSGFEYCGDLYFDKGRVYDVNTGYTYSGNCTVVNHSTLAVRGYILFTIFGRTEILTRVK